ncbi:MAG: hypothetical protein CMN30_15075 [Sandaracinus sp.]|nr:hypothetical protein [Sandaracinus sp.]
MEARSIPSVVILAMAALLQFTTPAGAQLPETNPYDDPNQPPPRPPAPPPEPAPPPVVEPMESSETLESDADASASSGTGASRPGEVDVLGAVVATAGIAGELVAPVCDGTRNLRPLPAADALESFVRRREEGALIVDTGGLLARHGVLRYIARRQPEALARLVRGLGYHALAFGEADLSDPRDAMIERVRALRDEGIPVLASNLRCDEANRELCDLLTTGADGMPAAELTDADGEVTRVAVFSFIEPEAAARVGPDRMAGLRLAPLTESIRLATLAARERGVNTVIAIIDSGPGATAAGRAMSAVNDLEAQEKPDVILSADAGSELLFARPAGFRPAIIAPPPRGATDVRLRRNRVTHTSDILARPVATNGTPAAAVVRFAEAVGANYCSTFGLTLPGGQLTLTDDEGAPVPMTPAALADLAAGVMREATDTDVAVLNRGAMDERWVPTNPRGLTRSDVHVAVQYDEQLVVAEVPASFINTLARSNPGGRGLVALGVTLEKPDGVTEKVMVNGRVLDDSARYRVVTVRFLAQGGDGGALGGATDQEWEPVPDTTLRTTLEEFLVEPHGEDPREAVLDMRDVLEWTTRIHLDANFAGTAVRDPNAYGEGPLTNSSQALFAFNTQLALNALGRHASWENLAVANYSLARTSDSGGLDEGSDLLTYKTTGLYRGFRAEHEEIYVPDLLVEGLVRTEFTKADERDHRFMNLRFVGGAQFRLHLKAQARLVTGVEIIEVFDDQLRSTRPGFGAQLNLGPWVAMQAGRRKLTLTANLDWFYTSPGTRNRHVLQGLFDMQLDLTAAFALNLNVTLYGLRDTVPATESMPENDGELAFAIQTTAGLRVAWTERWLAF